MVSPTYKQFAQAMAAKKQIVCEYDGYARELCAVILGHTGGQEKALTFQFGGQSKSGLSPNGEWRWLFLEKVRNMHLRDGPWRAGEHPTARLRRRCRSRRQSDESIRSKAPAVSAFLADGNVGNPFSDVEGEANPAGDEVQRHRFVQISMTPERKRSARKTCWNPRSPSRR